MANIINDHYPRVKKWRNSTKSEKYCGDTMEKYEIKEPLKMTK